MLFEKPWRIVYNYREKRYAERADTSSAVSVGCIKAVSFFL